MLSRPVSCSGLGPLPAGAALPPEKLAPKLSIPPQPLPRTPGSLSTQVLVTDLSLLSQDSMPRWGTWPIVSRPEVQPQPRSRTHTSLLLHPTGRTSHMVPPGAVWGLSSQQDPLRSSCGGTSISSTHVPPETADAPRDVGLPTCPRPHTAPLNSPPQGPRSAAVDGNSSMARGSALCPQQDP